MPTLEQIESNRVAFLQDAITEAMRWQERFLSERLVSEDLRERLAKEQVRLAKCLLECDAHKKARAEHCQEQERLHMIIARLRAKIDEKEWIFTAGSAGKKPES